MTGPHQGQPARAAGAPLAEAAAALVLVHGRGGDAGEMLALGEELGRPGLALLAPPAAGHTWYPYSFMAPLAANEPWLSSALARVGELVTEVEDAGVPPERVALLGFSQGACLTLESVARRPRRYGAIVALIGGLIGPPGTPRDSSGSLAGTPVYLASADPDPHVPWERVEESAEVLRRLGAEVTVERFPGLPHTVHPSMLARAAELLDRIVPPAG